MKRLLVVLLLVAAPVSGLAQSSTDTSTGAMDFLTNLKTSFSKHLGRPYVWGGAGLKSFDCSGFIWRVMFENGILVKRTTARKFYMMLPKVKDADRWNFGTLVFFDNLKHVGIVDSAATFYHAQVSRGTNLSKFDPFWRPKVYGFRALPAKK